MVDFHARLDDGEADLAREVGQLEAEDLLVAVNVVTQGRRILNQESISEGTGKKRLLKG